MRLRLSITATDDDSDELGHCHNMPVGVRLDPGTSRMALAYAEAPEQRYLLSGSLSP